MCMCSTRSARRAPSLPRLLSSLLLALPTGAVAGGGPLGIDHRLSYDDRGIWHRRAQRDIEYATMAAVAGGAVWFGGESRLGRTYWEALDAGAIALGSGELAKRMFGRPRPNESDDPNQWFQ